MGLNGGLPIRDDIREAMEAYGRGENLHPGSFIRAVLENDLLMAGGVADPYNRAALCDTVQWCFNNLPRACWGSKEKVKAWLERHSNRKEAVHA